MRVFSQEEIENIKIDYHNGMCPKDLGIKYNRNPSSIINKLQSLGEFNATKQKWTKEEEQILIDNYSKMSVDDICKMMPNRNKQNIVTKASKMGLKNEIFFWNEDEIQTLKDYYLLYGAEYVQEKLNHKFTIGAIQTKAQKLGIVSFNRWTEEEHQILRDYYSIKTVDEIAAMIPNHARKSIIERAMELGLKSGIFYTPEEEEYIRNNWQSQTDEEIAVVLGRTSRKIRDKRLNMKLCRVEHGVDSYKQISDYLRGNNYEWKKKSMEACNYKCVLSGEKFTDIHHIFGFNMIVDQVLQRLKIYTVEMPEFTQEQLDIILKEFKQEQDKHPLGACLRKDLHISFHQIYGHGNNTIEQWKQYVSAYKSNYQSKN